MIIDSHCHIQFKAYNENREDVIKRTREKAVLMNLVGTQKDTSEEAVDLAEQYDGMFATIGLHPIHTHEVGVREESVKFNSRSEKFDYGFFDDLAKSPKVIGVGETGLDAYHIPKNRTTDGVLEDQKVVFLAHYEFARDHNLPLVIHIRDAHEDMIDLLRGLKKPIHGVVHCFTSDWEDARRYLDFGLYLGFTGVITFPVQEVYKEGQTNIGELLEVVKKCPLDRILVETDAPFMKPQKYRGEKQSEPWMVEEVVKTIADLKGISPEKLAEITVKNTKRLFTKITGV